jgi:tetratricopeptide (TPR) repeat protein
MAGEIFLARTEEQEKFRQVLKAHDKTLWQKLNTPIFPKPPAENGLPFLLLFYGEGGMGKTRLIRRLLQLAEEEKPLKGKFNTLFVDWEDKQNHHLGLQVGHDSIQPETVLQVLHDAFVAKDWGGCFGEYRKLVKELKEIEAKVDKELKSKPDDKIQEQVRKLGAKGIAWIIRQAPVASNLPSQPLESALETTIQVGAEGLYQARQFVQAALTPKEYEIYAQPHERLAEALGKGIAELAKRKPLVMFLDTYEIVDRPECDYTLRSAIRCSGQRVVWVIAGRANLADSGQRGNRYFRGYKRDFPENYVYAKALSEFGSTEIQEYFSKMLPGQSLTDEEVEAVARFSLGIPFVISQAAAMWKEGKPLNEIVAPVQTILGKTTLREQVVRETSERFLMHCFSAKERERDLRAVYALAMMRRPDVELLKTMLDVTDLMQELQSLRERYSFIWVEEVRLDEKLAQFLREYLLAPVRRNDSMVQELNKQAILWLELQLENLTRDIPDTAERLENDRIAETILDLAHHQFWQGEEEGWRYLVPRLVEGWQYNRPWARSLLEIAEAFHPTFSNEGQHRLKLFSKMAQKSFVDPNDSRQTLEEVEKLAQRKWLDGDGAGERKAILLLQRGQWLYWQEKYKEALPVYLEVERQLPENAVQLRKDLAEAFQIIGWKFAVEQGNVIPSLEAEEVCSKAVALNGDDGHNLVALGAAQAGWQKYEEAIASITKGIELGADQAYSHNCLGNVYKAQGKLDEAIAAYQRAIQLDPKYAYPHYNLGNMYSDQGKLDEAIAAYQKAIQLDPKDASPHYNLAIVYKAQGKLEQAIAAYQSAIQLGPKDASPHNGLGNVYKAQGKLEQAIAAYQQAIQLDPKYAYPHNGLGLVYEEQGNYDQALTAYQKAIKVDPEWATPHTNLGDVYRKRGKLEEAIAAYQQAIELDPKSAYPHNNLGNVYEAQGKLEQAIAAYQQAIELDPKSATAHNNLGNVYEAQGKLDEVIAAYQQAIQLDPKYDSACNSLAWTYLLKGDLTLAKEKFEQAINLDPNASAYVFNLGLVYALEGNVDEAQNHWQKGLAMCQDSDAWDGAIRALYTVAVGETEKGIAEMQKIIDEEGSRVGALRNALGDAEILARCPVKPAGIDTVVEMLKQALN